MMLQKLAKLDDYCQKQLPSSYIVTFEIGKNGDTPEKEKDYDDEDVEDEDDQEDEYDAEDE